MSQKLILIAIYIISLCSCEISNSKSGRLEKDVFKISKELFIGKTIENISSEYELAYGAYSGLFIKGEDSLLGNINIVLDVKGFENQFYDDSKTYGQIYKELKGYKVSTYTISVQKYFQIDTFEDYLKSKLINKWKVDKRFVESRESTQLIISNESTIIVYEIRTSSEGLAKKIFVSVHI